MAWLRGTGVSPVGSVGLALLMAGGCGSDRDDSQADGGSAGDGILTLSGGDDNADGGETGVRLDVGDGMESAGPGDCPGGGGGGMMNGDFSYIWIANSPEGTVSKINTKTGIEEGRYFTGPTSGADDPSRTSVNLAGDVAVSNRSGGVTKIAALPAGCVDSNSNGTIETSTGPANILPWGTDECMLWHVPLPNGGAPNTTGTRPTAWDAGVGATPCDTADDRLWVGWNDLATTSGIFRRLSGATGTLLDEVSVDNWVTTFDNYGPYGGATDQNGNLWVTGLEGPLVFIDGTTLAHQRWPAPAGTRFYGMALDANGEPWIAGTNRDLTHFNPATQQFEVFSLNAAGRGLQVDRNGFAWIAGNGPCTLMQFDTAAKVMINGAIPLPGCGTPVGVSIDIDGNVWLPDQIGLAFKVDPITYAATTTPGLVGPYTYSDMTGAGLDLVVNPPQG